MSLTRELRFALRTLVRAPGPSVVAVFALGVGIGLCTLIFSVMRGSMLRPLPFDEPHEIVSISRTVLESGWQSMPTIHDFAAWRDSNRSAESIGAYLTRTVNFSGNAIGVPERLRGAAVTPSVFAALGVQPVVGRLFGAADDIEGATPVILLSWEVWQRRFDGEAAVLGQTVRVDGIESTVIGVLPEGFGFPQSQQIWRPLRWDADRIPWESGRHVQVVGRLRDGVSIDAAAADLARITARVGEEHPETHGGYTARVAAFGATSDQTNAMMLIMMGAVFAVLAIACANVANLLVGRAISRTKEVGIRLAMGASRLRVAAPFLAESGVLAVGGAMLGVATAYAGLAVFNRSIAEYNPPFWMDFSIDGYVLAFVAVAACLAALLAGVIPAWQASRLSLHDTLKDESRGATGFRLGRVSRSLVVVEVALSLGLLAAAGLMVRSVSNLDAMDLGVPAEEVFVARADLPESDYPDAQARRRFAADLLARLETLPRVRALALAAGAPGRYDTDNAPVAIEGETDTGGGSSWAAAPIVSADYFEAFNAGPIRGRAFGPADDVGAPPVAIVNQSFEERFFGDGGALGRRVRLGDETAPWLTVVGVVPDLPENGILNPLRAGVYRPITQNPLQSINIIARAEAAPLRLTRSVRDHVLALDPDLPIYDVNTLRGAVRDDNFMTSIFGGLFSTFGFAALVLASVGLYGVMSFAVGQRRREVGVRIAVGARPRNVLSLILLGGMRQVAIGLAIGAVFAFALSRAIASSLFGVSPQDPIALAGTALLLVAVSAVACAVPAFRAARTDPVEALRSE